VLRNSPKDKFFKHVIEFDGPNFIGRAKEEYTTEGSLSGVQKADMVVELARVR
jgi:hypothetical protein